MQAALCCMPLEERGWRRPGVPLWSCARRSSTVGLEAVKTYIQVLNTAKNLAHLLKRVKEAEDLYLQALGGSKRFLGAQAAGIEILLRL